MQPLLEPLGLKSSRALLYKAFSLQDCREENRADLVKGSVGEGDQDRSNWTWRCYHYHALQFLNSLQFVSDTNYQSEIARNTGNVMMLEHMSALEKKMEDKNSEMIKMLQFINTRVSEYPPAGCP